MRMLAEAFSMPAALTVLMVMPVVQIENEKAISYSIA